VNKLQAEVVVIVEDDSTQRDEVLLALQLAGISAFGAPDGATLDKLMQVHRVDVVVLDVGLPGESGLQIAARLAAQPEPVGLVMLTGQSAMKDRLSGMAHGADAYLAKPADPREVIATITALRRRMAKAATAAAATAHLPPAAGGWQLAPSGRQLSFGLPAQIVKLTELQQLFLQRFVGLAVGQPVGREQLMQALGHDRFDSDHHRLETLVSRLRQKVREQLGQDLPIEALPGRGYAMTQVLELEPGA
jgi:DNA-binding response OmpR family regulator